MKRFIAALLFLPLPLMAQDIVTIEKEIFCGNASAFYEAITGPKFNEQPVWFGTNEHISIILFVNKKSGGWTILQYRSSVGCILDAGKESKFLPDKGEKINNEQLDLQRRRLY